MRNVVASTTKTDLYIEYDPVSNDGGSAITNYYIYIDDGMNGAYSAAADNNLLLTFNKNSLTSGLTYRVAYSAVNAQGEGPMSDATSITLAVVPTVV